MKRPLFIILLLVFFIACQNGSDQTIENQQPPMAPIMRQMLEDLKTMKSSIQDSGKWVGSIPEEWKSFHQAVASQKSQSGEAFDLQRSVFLNLINEASTQGVIRAESLNLITQSCISCHQQYCPGPIKTIKKQLISGT